MKMKNVLFSTIKHQAFTNPNGEAFVLCHSLHAEGERICWSQVYETSLGFEYLLKGVDKSRRLCVIYGPCNLDMISFILAAIEEDMPLMIRRTSLCSGEEIWKDFLKLSKTIRPSFLFSSQYPLFEGKAIFESRGHLYAIDEGDILPSDAAFVQMSSGTLGFPKAYCLTLESLMHSAFGVIRGNEIAFHSSILSCLTMAHIFGFTCGYLIPMLIKGRSVYCETPLLRQNPAIILDQMEKHAVSFSALVPSLIMKACQKAEKIYHLANLKCIALGGMTLTPNIIDELTDLFSPFGVDRKVFINSYGMSELGAITMESPSHGNHIAYLDGNAYLSVGSSKFGDTTIKIMAKDGVGENSQTKCGLIGIRSPYLASGYFLKHQFFSLKKDKGFYYNGDIGFERDGHIYVLGRKNNMLIYNGIKTNSERVSDFVLSLLHQHSLPINHVFVFNLPETINLIILMIDGKAVVKSVLDEIKERTKNEFHILIFDICFCTLPLTSIEKKNVQKSIREYLRQVKLDQPILFEGNTYHWQSQIEGSYRCQTLWKDDRMIARYRSDNENSAD